MRISVLGRTYLSREKAFIYVTYPQYVKERKAV